MRATILEATAEGPAVVVFAGRYCVGDVAYRFARPAGALPANAVGRPVMWVDGGWRESQLARPVWCGWDDVAEVID